MILRDTFSATNMGRGAYDTTGTPKPPPPPPKRRPSASLAPSQLATRTLATPNSHPRNSQLASSQLPTPISHPRNLSTAVA
ncbi:hypothetical protein K490DRAFT_60967 [Saccharata proteae CBS 121410]|uniref:Uncharacterized protein n=1 Tax=Saccharata proteae CBS 121410 TaxID=1314787 RepID=A0A9P4M1U4_9PEZI|nr:hypothetical protein K490DRAFT_60967 [Saccharata proteae CBS 121410]